MKVHYADAEAGTPTACGLKQAGLLVTPRRHGTTCINCRRARNRRKVIWQERMERIGSLRPSRVERLRRRDGDCCWLCRQPIDFTLTGNDEVWGPSVDHVIPRVMGGGNELENKKLAHRQCNSSRAALYPQTIPGAPPRERI